MTGPRRIAVACLAMAVVVAVSCRDAPIEHPPVEPIAVSTQTREIESPAGPGSGEPNLAVDGQGHLLASWLEPAGDAGHALRFARFSGGTWTPPVTVVERDDLFVNWADFPSVAVASDGALFAHWLQKSAADPYAYDVMMAASEDGGRTWGRPFILHDDGRRAEHGFVSMVQTGSPGEIGVAWLDGRDMTESSDGDVEGSMTLRFARAGVDRSVKQEAMLDDRTCECCQTSLGRTSDGFVVVYRDRSEEEIRDIAVVRFAEEGRWSAPRLVHGDGWQIAGCPVNGPALDVRGRFVTVAWFTAAEETRRVFAAFSSDGGMTFSDPISIDEGSPVGRIDLVTLEGGSSIVTWIEQEGESAAVLARRIAPDGRWGEVFRVGSSSEARSAGFPRVAAVGGTVYFAWTEPGEPSRIRISAADLKG